MATKKTSKKNSKVAKKAAKKVAWKTEHSASTDDKLVTAFKIRFTAPLIMHAFSQKAMEEILRKQLGLPVEQTPKVPSQCLELATTRNTKGQPCILPAAFKKATLSGAAGLELAKGLKLRSQFWIVGQSVPIKFEGKIDRVDMVKVGPWNKRVSDVRFRPMFHGVKCTIVVKVPAKINPGLVVDLLDRGGEMGVGEWRPSRGGSYGTYEVDDVVTAPAQIRAAMRACDPMIPPLVIPSWALDAEISPTVLARIMAEQQAEAQAD